MNNEGKALSLIYNKKIIIEGLGNRSIEKECVVRKKPDQYASITLDNIRYLIFEDKNLDKYDENHYTILGKKLDGGKFKNYFLAEMSSKEVVLISGAMGELTYHNLITILEKLVSSFKDHKKVFFNYVKKEYGVEYNK